MKGDWETSGQRLCFGSRYFVHLCCRSFQAVLFMSLTRAITCAPRQVCALSTSTLSSSLNLVGVLGFARAACTSFNPGPTRPWAIWARQRLKPTCTVSIHSQHRKEKQTIVYIRTTTPFAKSCLCPNLSYIGCTRSEDQENL